MALALVYIEANYAAPTLCGSWDASTIDLTLNGTMRTELLRNAYD